MPFINDLLRWAMKAAAQSDRDGSGPELVAGDVAGFCALLGISDGAILRGSDAEFTCGEIGGWVP